MAVQSHPQSRPSTLSHLIPFNACFMTTNTFPNCTNTCSIFHFHMFFVSIAALRFCSTNFSVLLVSTGHAVVVAKLPEYQQAIGVAFTITAYSCDTTACSCDINCGTSENKWNYKPTKSATRWIVRWRVCESPKLADQHVVSLVSVVFHRFVRVRLFYCN